MKAGVLVMCAVASLALSAGCDGGQRAAEPEPVEPAEAPAVARVDPGAARAPEVVVAEPEPEPVPVVPCGGSAGSDLPGVYIEILGPCRISLSEDGPLPDDLTELEQEHLATGPVDHMIRYRVVVEDGAPSELVPGLPHPHMRSEFGVAAFREKRRAKKPGKKAPEKRYFTCDEPGPSGLVVDATLAGIPVDAPVTRPPSGNSVACNPLGPVLYGCEDREPNALTPGVHEHRFVFNGRTKKPHEYGYSWSRWFEVGEYPLVIRAKGIHEVDGEWVPFHMHASATVHVVE
jgi:hypothetical protein